MSFFDFQIPKLTTIQRLAVIPRDNDLIFDIDSGQMFAGDGATFGGIILGQAGINYTHTQAAPSDTWIINHNLGKYPSISVMSVGEVEFESDIHHINKNQARIYLAIPQAGIAQCN